MDALVSPALSRHRATPTPVLRHLAHFGPLLVLSAAAFLLATLRTAPGTPLALSLFYGLVVGLNVAALTMSSWSTLLGAIVAPFSRASRLSGGPRLAPPTGQARTAVLLPIYEEDVARVFATVRAMAESLAAETIGEVDFFVLSDSRSAVAVAAEDAMVALSARADGPPIFYRRRTDNKGRKAGNIAEFCERWGDAYDFMVILDADSLMTGEAIARLVGAMEANPSAGLIQAMCYPVGRHSLFARLQQFNARLYGPLFQRGVSFWQGPRGNYWGHNAIVRIAPFVAACGLPLLPGRAPFGGEILSHDTVEAALMLRAGYDVWMLPDGPGGRHDGSWEETPTNLLDHLERDRRWCRGNLQHALVLRARGLKLASLYHLTRGLLHYLYAPLVVMWLVLYALVDRHGAPDALLWLVAALVVVPRVLCVCGAMADPSQAQDFGGRAALAGSALLDQAVVALSYPVTLVFHLVFLAGTLLGGETRWDAQARDDRGLFWGETARRLGPPLASALVVLAVLAPFAPWPAALLAPGLLLAVPLAVLTSRRSKVPTLLRTPDDTRPHPLRAARAIVEARLRSGLRLDPSATPPPLPEEAGLPIRPQVLRPARS